MSEPLLSIGIIFKNEIRCLERCLKSLEPLRQAIPCELVMADTGADDGSREIAEKYADILIDFPWINDFAAARNAVMDRCSGAWYMTIDCDEWVDSNIQGFVKFLTGKYDFDFASVIVRNYNTTAVEKGSYADFLATRLLRMSTGLRYEGAVHEHWVYKGNLRTMMIHEAIFHHDGYVVQNKELKDKKQKRNLPLLKKLLEEKPEDLIVLIQCIESTAGMLEQEELLRRALAGVREKWPQWELFGPPIYRHAVHIAVRDHLPELEEWLGEAESMFPDSIFLRVETACFAFGHYWGADNYEKAISWGERYLQGVADYRAGNFNQVDLLASALDKVDTHTRLDVSVILAEGYLHEKQPDKCANLLAAVDFSELDAKQIEVGMRSVCRLRSEFGMDNTSLMLRCWKELNQPIPDREAAAQRRKAFIRTGSRLFTREYRESETAPVYCHAYAVFLPLAGCCALGDAAMILETEAISQIERLLRSVNNWNELPIAALVHALEQGICFPLPDKPLNVEEINSLASRLAQDQESLRALVEEIAERLPQLNTRQLDWARSLVLSAVRSISDWTDAAQSEWNMKVIRAFAQVERLFLPRCYAPEALCDENIGILPPMHRFGWYCSQAFQALDGGDSTTYVRLLRQGLKSCPEVKCLVEFLVKQLEEKQEVQAVPELIVLAEKIRTLLFQYPAGDPAVEALKQSAAYQTVAHLIEGPDLGILGGLAQ